VSLLKNVPPPKRPETIKHRERQLRWDDYLPWRFIEGEEIIYEGKTGVVESTSGEFVCMLIDGEFIARHQSNIKDPRLLDRVKRDLIDYCCGVDCKITDKPAPISEFLAAPRPHIPSLYGCTVFVWNSKTKKGFFHVSEKISSIEAVEELQRKGDKAGVPDEFNSEFNEMKASDRKRYFHFFHLVDGAWIEMFRGCELGLIMTLINTRFIPNQHRYPSQQDEATTLQDWVQIAGTLGYFYPQTKELRDQRHGLDLPDITEFDVNNIGKRLSQREDTPDYFCNVDPDDYELLDTDTDPI